MGIATGGSVERIVVESNGNGHALIGGGNLVLTASAGYVGSAIVGALMIAGARGGKGARAMLLAAAAFLAVSMFLFVRGDIVGVISGIAWVAVLALAGLRLPHDWRLFVAQFLGVQLCLTSAHALFTLLNLSISSEAMTDAETLERVTGLPGTLWALGWFAVSAIAVALSLRRAWKGSDGSTSA